MLSSDFGYRDKLVVAPYGFDQTMWDPSRDELLPENFSVSDMKGKGICKSSLQQHVGLSEDASSILVCLSSTLVICASCVCILWRTEFSAMLDSDEN